MSESSDVRTYRTECPNCGMPFDVPEYADRCWCDCGESWEVDLP